jgi:DNA replication protein DnaC
MGNEIERLNQLRENAEKTRQSEQPQQVKSEIDMDAPNVWNEKRDTGAKCPNCSRPLFEGTIHFWGTSTVYKITCQCEVDKRKEQEKLDKQAQHRRYIADLHHRSGLPRKWENIALESFEPRKGAERSYKACCNYSENFQSLQNRGIGMYLFGTSGSGKTRLAASIANKLLDKGVPVKWWNVTNLYFAIQGTFNGNGSSQEILDNCTRAGLLILDDIGAEKPSEWTMSTMYEILNTRIDDMLPTIITSNLKFEELSKVADPRVISRISDKDIFPHVANEATDYRREPHGH